MGTDTQQGREKKSCIKTNAQRPNLAQASTIDARVFLPNTL